VLKPGLEGVALIEGNVIAKVGQIILAGAGACDVGPLELHIWSGLPVKFRQVVVRVSRLPRPPGPAYAVLDAYEEADKRDKLRGVSVLYGCSATCYCLVQLSTPSDWDNSLQ
jgi:hypothetical protein